MDQDSFDGFLGSLLSVETKILEKNLRIDRFRGSARKVAAGAP